MESLANCFCYGLKDINDDGLLCVFHQLTKLDSSLLEMESQVLNTNNVSVSYSIH